jgi:hypothetical protein
MASAACTSLSSGGSESMASPRAVTPSTLAQLLAKPARKAVSTHLAFSLLQLTPLRLGWAQHGFQSRHDVQLRFLRGRESVNGLQEVHPGRFRNIPRGISVDTFGEEHGA